MGIDPKTTLERLSYSPADTVIVIRVVDYTIRVDPRYIVYRP
jgi:hypothetical protein